MCQLNEAAVHLIAAGYTRTALPERCEHDPEFAERSVRLRWASAGIDIVLLPSRDWYFDLGQELDYFLPPLDLFLGSLFDFWLNISSQNYVQRLRFALYIGCLINDCYKLTSLNGHALNENAYAANLKPEHRELHYDIVSCDPKAESFTTRRRHEYHVRRRKEIAEGVFSPQPYKAGAFRSDLTVLVE